MGGSPPPTAGFYADVTSGPAPLTVIFYDQSVGATEKWIYYGDGTYNKYYDAQIDKTYLYPGIYTVQQIVSNADGSAEVTKTDYITVYEEVVTPEDAAQATETWGIFQASALARIARRQRLEGMKGTITDETDTEKF